MMSYLVLSNRAVQGVGHVLVALPDSRDVVVVCVQPNLGLFRRVVRSVDQPVPLFHKAPNVETWGRVRPKRREIAYTTEW